VRIENETVEETKKRYWENRKIFT